MVKLLALSLSVLQLSALSLAGPLIPQDDPASESITPELFSILNLYQQYAAAAYCVQNFDSTYRQVRLACPSQNCPEVENSNTTITLQLLAAGNYAVNAYVAVDYTHQLIVFAVRGTNTSSSGSVAADLFSVAPVRLAALCSGCSGGAGFYNSWASVKDLVTQKVKEALSANPLFRIVTVGHSLGGATATVAAFELRKDSAIGTPIDLASYGAPRVGNQNFVNLLQTQDTVGESQNYRVTHIGDLVPNISPLGDYVQIQPNYFIGSGNNVTATAADVKVNTDPENVTPQLSLQRILGGFSTVKDDTAAAHAQYINNIEACGSAAPVTNLPGSQPLPGTIPLDPNAPFDPNTQPYDPNAQIPPFDPNAPPYDPNAQLPPSDPNAPPLDPNAQQPSWTPPTDPNAPYDPNAPLPYDPNAQPFDPNAPPYDPNSQPYNPNTPPYNPSAPAPIYDPGLPYDPNAPPPPPYDGPVFNPGDPGYDPYYDQGPDYVPVFIPAAVGPRPAALDSIFDQYIQEVKEQKIIPHPQRQPGTRGRPRGNTWKPPTRGRPQTRAPPRRRPNRGPNRGPSRGPNRGPNRGQPTRGPVRGQPTRGPIRGQPTGPIRGQPTGPIRGQPTGPIRGQPTRGPTPIRGQPTRGPSPIRGQPTRNLPTQRPTPVRNQPKTPSQGPVRQPTRPQPTRNPSPAKTESTSGWGSLGGLFGGSNTAKENGNREVPKSSSGGGLADLFKPRGGSEPAKSNSGGGFADLFKPKSGSNSNRETPKSSSGGGFADLFKPKSGSDNNRGGNGNRNGAGKGGGLGSLFGGGSTKAPESSSSFGGLFGGSGSSRGSGNRNSGSSGRGNRNGGGRGGGRGGWA